MRRGIGRPGGRLWLLLAVGTLCVVLVGCSSAPATPAGPSDTAPVTISPSATAPSALVAGLLPTGSFGVGYTTTPISADQLKNFDPAAGTGDFTVEPAECAGIQQSLSAFSQAADLAGQTAAPSDASRNTYAEIIAAGAGGLGVDLSAARAQVGSCGSAVLTRSDGTRIEATYSLVDLGALGDDSLGLQTTASINTGGQSQQVVVINALVLDGDRLLAMISITNTPGTLDPGFPDLVARAYAYQHDALG